MMIQKQTYSVHHNLLYKFCFPLHSLIYREQRWILPVNTIMYVYCMRASCASFACFVGSRVVRVSRTSCALYRKIKRFRSCYHFVFTTFTGNYTLPISKCCNECLATPTWTLAITVFLFFKWAYPKLSKSDAHYKN